MNSQSPMSKKKLKRKKRRNTQMNYWKKLKGKIIYIRNTKKIIIWIKVQN